MEITITDLLRGVAIGRIQSVGYMQVIPLISDLVDDRFISPKDALVSTSNYGTLVIKNDSDNGSAGIMILPSGAGYVVPQAAQDHASPIAKLIAARRIATIDTAACIQQTQGGTMTSGRQEMTILPWGIKEAAFNTKDVKEYAKLWPAIGQFNTSLGLSNQAHLEFFLRDFRASLDEFIGQFEIVHRQIGAIVLMNGHVVGIERTPNYNYWKDVWKPLIRECYGSLTLQYAKKFGDDPPPPRTRVPLCSMDIDNAEDLQKALESATQKEAENVKSVVRRFVKTKFSRQEEQDEDGMRVDSIHNKQFAGQVVFDGERPVYLSLFTTGEWLKDGDWHEADEFKI